MITSDDVIQIPASVDSKQTTEQPYDVKLDSEFIQACSFGKFNIVKKMIQDDTSGLLVNKAARHGSTPLMFAAEGGHLDIVNLLLEHGADPNIINAREGYAGGLPTALFYAANQDHFNIARLLLTKITPECIDAVILAGSTKGLPLLWHVIFRDKNNWGFVLSLLEAGAKNIDTTCNNSDEIDVSLRGLTVLWLAINCEKWKVVRALLKMKPKNLEVSPLEGGSKGVTAIIGAAYWQQWDVVRELITLGANIDATLPEGANKGITVLWTVASYRQWDLVRLLLKKGIKNIDACPEGGSDKGKTAVWYAAAAEQWDLVAELLAAGAKKLDLKISESTTRDKSASLLAQHQKLKSNYFYFTNKDKAHDLAKKILLSKSQDDTIEKKTSLEEISKKLLEQGMRFIEQIQSDISVENLKLILLNFEGHYPNFYDQGLTALHYLIQRKNKSATKSKNPQASATELLLFKELLAAGADVNEKTDNGESPLSLAIVGNKTTLVQELLDPKHKTDLDCSDKNGQTALHQAVLLNRLDMLKQLLASNAKTDIRNVVKQTALMLAAIQQNKEAFEILLAHELSSAFKKEGTEAKDITDITQAINFFAKILSSLNPKFINNSTAFLTLKEFKSDKVSGFFKHLTKKMIQITLSDMIKIIKDLKTLPKDENNRTDAGDVEFLIIKSLKEGQEAIKLEEKAGIEETRNKIIDEYESLYATFEESYAGEVGAKLLNSLNSSILECAEEIEELIEKLFIKESAKLKKNATTVENSKISRKEEYTKYVLQTKDVYASINKTGKDVSDFCEKNEDGFMTYYRECDNKNAFELLSNFKTVLKAYKDSHQMLESILSSLISIKENLEKNLNSKNKKTTKLEKKLAKKAASKKESEESKEASEEDKALEEAALLLNKQNEEQIQEQQRKARHKANMLRLKEERKKNAEALATKQAAPKDNTPMTSNLGLTKDFDLWRQRGPSLLTLGGQTGIVGKVAIQDEFAGLREILSEKQSTQDLVVMEMECSAMRGGLARIFEVLLKNRNIHWIQHDVAQALRLYLFKGKRFVLEGEKSKDKQEALNEEIRNVTAQLLVYLGGQQNKSSSSVQPLGSLSLQSIVDSSMFDKIVKEAEEFVKSKDIPTCQKLLEEISLDEKTLFLYEGKNTNPILHSLAVGYIQGRLGANAHLLKVHYFSKYRENKETYDGYITPGNSFRHSESYWETWKEEESVVTNEESKGAGKKTS